MPLEGEGVNAGFYQQLKVLLLRGESPRLESSLERPGQERLVWRGGSTGGPLTGKVFAQTLTAPTRLVICGGGHVAQALAHCAAGVGFAVTVLEDRPDFLAPERFPAGTDLRQGDYQTLIGGDFGSAPFFAIMTRGHDMDWLCLETVLRRSYGYVGMMGSRRKAAMTRQRLLKAGVEEAVIDAIHTPIGMAIGAETPAEIAVSIVAQLIACRKGLGVEAPLEQALIDALDKPPFALVTLVECRGSTPRGAGARMLVFADGSTRGTIGGGPCEAGAIRQARQLLSEGAGASIYHYDMSVSAESICGGSVDYIIIPVREGDTPC